MSLLTCRSRLRSLAARSHAMEQQELAGTVERSGLAAQRSLTCWTRRSLGDRHFTCAGDYRTRAACREELYARRPFEANCTGTTAAWQHAKLRLSFRWRSYQCAAMQCHALPLHSALAPQSLPLGSLPAVHAHSHCAHCQRRELAVRAAGTAMRTRRCSKRWTTRAHTLRSALCALHSALCTLRSALCTH